MRDEQVFDLLAATNPIPDPDGLDSPLALAPPAERSGMSVQTRERVSSKSAVSRRRGAALVVASFVVVVAVGAVILMFTGGEGGFDAAQATPVEMSEEFARRLDDGDFQGAAALVSDSHSGVRFPVQGLHAGREGLVDFFAFYSAIGGNTDLANCLEPEGSGLVSCDVSQSSRVLDSLGVRPLEGSMTFTVGANEISAVNFIVPLDDLADFVAARDAYEQWIESERPTQADRLFDGGEVVKTAEAGALYLELIAEYLASR